MDDENIRFMERTLCNGCGHVWVATYALGTDLKNLECPRCGILNSEQILLTLSQEIEMALSGAAIMSVSQDDNIRLEENIAAETMERKPFEAIPLRICFANGKELYLEVLGWRIETGEGR